LDWVEGAHVGVDAEVEGATEFGWYREFAGIESSMFSLVTAAPPGVGVAS